MALWADKHRPKCFDDLSLHQGVSNRLRQIAAQHDLPHLLLHGPAGGGKRTRVAALLPAIYGADSGKVELSDGKTMSLELETLDSKFHSELNLIDMGAQDRYAIQEVVKDVAKSQVVLVLVLHDVDRLSKNAQHALRRTMEKYAKTCRMILLCQSLCRVTAPIRSRCLVVRVPLPTHDEIAGELLRVAASEVAPLTRESALRIAVASSRNLRRALLLLESCWTAGKKNQADSMDLSKAKPPEWMVAVREQCQNLCREPFVHTLKVVRTRLYDVLAAGVPASSIFSVMVDELVSRAQSATAAQATVQAAARYEHSWQGGTKAIYHLEAFMACALLSLEAKTAPRKPLTKSA